MVEPGRGPIDRLDVPLKWERGAPPAAESAPLRPPPPQQRWGHLRLWVAALADLGVVLLALAAAWGVAASLGVTLTPPQIATAGLAGLLLATVVGIGVLWGWRGTPGMVLLRLRFAAPLELAGAIRVWCALLLSLPLAGVPLLLGRRGRTLAERQAGSELRLS